MNITLTKLLIWIPTVIFWILIIYQSLFSINTSNTIHNLLIDSASQNSHIKNTPTIFKVIITLELFLTSFLSNSWSVLFLIISLCAFLTICIGKTGFKIYLKLLGIPLSFLIISTIALMLNFSSYPLEETVISFPVFKIFISITKSSYIRAITVFLRALAAVSALYFLVLSTPVYAIFSLLKRWHCPNLFLELMILIYRYIFILWQVSEELVQAASLRFGINGLKRSIHTMGRIFSSLFIISIKRADDYYNALETRLFNGTFRFINRENRMTFQQILLLLFLTIYLILIEHFNYG